MKSLKFELGYELAKELSRDLGETGQEITLDTILNDIDNTWSNYIDFELGDYGQLLVPKGTSL